jgi:propionyl-CoA:succinyl-CoA transferase
MAFKSISAAEAASLVKHGYNIGLSGFTPAGTAKAVTSEIGKIAEAEHAKGNPFQIGIFTGASTGDSCDGILSRVKAIRYRAPYTTNPDFRKAVNNGEIAYNDIHLSQMAQEVRYGFMGKVNVAIIEACEVTPDGKIYLTAAGGIAPTVCRLADQIIVELNSAHSKNMMGMHDVYEPLDPPYRREIPIYKPSDRIGLPYIQVDPKKIVGIVETNWPDEARSFAAADPITDKIGQNVADFLAADMKRGIIPSTFLPLQSGVGNIANAVLGALGRDQTIPALLVDFLKFAYSRTDIFRKLYKALPVAGIDGTLKNRMKQGAAFKNVHAKTGSYTAINTLAGYLKMANGHHVAFAIMNQNILSAAKARNFQNKVCEILANYQ